MPELPEVETFKKYFNDTSLHQKIEKVTCKNASLLKKISCAKLNLLVKGNEFDTASRRGKFLIAPIKKTDYIVIFHFGMTGSLAYGKEKTFTKQQTSYAQVTFTFEKNEQLIWMDIRKFGRVYVVKALDEVPELKTMGPEPLTLTKKGFLLLLESKKNKNIKAFLMDQKNIAGIGNNYSNEMLYQSEMSPKNIIKNISTQHRKKLYSTMKTVLKKAIILDGSKSPLPSSWLLAHKESDKKCPDDKKHSLKRITIGGRTAIYCPEHQVEYSQ